MNATRSVLIVSTLQQSQRNNAQLVLVYCGCWGINPKLLWTPLN